MAHSKPKAKLPTTVQVGRHTRALPQSTATPEGRARAALVRQLDRVEKLKEQHAKELAAKNAQLAQQARDHRRDSLVIIASQAADGARLDAAASKKFIAQVLAEDARWNPPADAHGTRPAFPVREVMARLLDAIAKETDGAAGVVDVRKLSAQEYREHLRKRGLVDPFFGSHCPV